MGPQGKRFKFVPVDRNSERRITGQLREEAEPCPDRRKVTTYARSQKTSPTTHVQKDSLEGSDVI